MSEQQQRSTAQTVLEALAAGAGPPLGMLLVWQLQDESSRLRLWLSGLHERLSELSILVRVEEVTGFAPVVEGNE